MTPIEILTIIGCVAVVSGTIALSIVRKIKAKKSGCAPSCCGCKYASQCQSANKEKTK